MLHSIGTNDQLRVVFHYLFHCITKYQYRSQVGDIHKELWKRCEVNGYLLLNCKLYVYQLHYCRAKGLRPASPTAFEIDKADVRFLQSLWLPIQFPIKPLTLEQFQELERSYFCSEHMSAHIGKFVYRKMRFLEAYGVSQGELRTQLLEAGIYSMRKQYPRFKSQLHALNIAKTGIHNRGIGLINYWNCDKRKALQLEQGAFKSRFVQLDYAPEAACRPEHEAAEVQHDINALIAKATGTQATALVLLSGRPDLGFSLFLGKDNVEVAHELSYPDYLAKVAAYLSMSVDRLSDYLRSLRTL